MYGLSHTQLHWFFKLINCLFETPTRSIRKVQRASELEFKKFFILSILVFCRQICIVFSSYFQVIDTLEWTFPFCGEIDFLSWVFVNEIILNWSLFLSFLLRDLVSVRWNVKRHVCNNCRPFYLQIFRNLYFN